MLNDDDAMICLTMTKVKAIYKVMIDVLGYVMDTRTLIRSRRAALNMSQAELASRMRVDQAFVSRIEGGNTDLPLGRVKLLAQALQIEEMEILRAVLEGKGIKAKDDQAVMAEIAKLYDAPPATPTFRRKRTEKVAAIGLKAVPIVGSVPAEGAMLALKNDEPLVEKCVEFVNIDESLVRSSWARFAVRVKGDYMKDIYEDGQLLVVGSKPYGEGSKVLVKFRGEDEVVRLGLLETGDTLKLVQPRKKYSRAFHIEETEFVFRVTVVVEQ